MAAPRTRYRAIEGEDGIIPEPAETEEDRRNMEETWRRIQEESRLAIEAGERLPPITADIWGVEDLKK